MFHRESTRRARPHRPVLTQRSMPPVARAQCAAPTFERQRPRSQVLRSPRARQATTSSAQMPEPAPVQPKEWEATDTTIAIICQANKDGASTSRVNRSRQAICAANAIAQPSVKRSPRFPDALGFTSSQSPTSGNSGGQPHTPVESAQNQWHDDDIQRRNEGGVRCGGIVEPDRLENIAEKEPAGRDRTCPQDRRLAVQAKSPEQKPAPDQQCAQEKSEKQKRRAAEFAPTPLSWRGTSRPR